MSRPDSTRPSENPLAPKAEYTLMARVRMGPSWNVVVSSDSPAGAVNAAAMPLMNRAAISRPTLLTSPPNSEATANRARAARKTRAPAQQVGGAAAEQQQAAVAEHVAADHPLQRRRGQPEVGADGGQSHADHRHVERVEEQGPAEHDQDGPQRGLHCWAAGPLGRHCGRAGGRTPARRALGCPGTKGLGGRCRLSAAD